MNEEIRGGVERRELRVGGAAGDVDAGAETGRSDRVGDGAAIRAVADQRPAPACVAFRGETAERARENVEALVLLQSPDAEEQTLVSAQAEPRADARGIGGGPLAIDRVQVHRIRDDVDAPILHREVGAHGIDQRAIGREHGVGG